jgi:hypothetical protein
MRPRIPLHQPAKSRAKEMLLPGNTAGFEHCTFIQTLDSYTGIVRTLFPPNVESILVCTGRCSGIQAARSPAGFAERRLFYDMTSSNDHNPASQSARSLFLFPRVPDAHDSIGAIDKKVFAVICIVSKWRSITRYNLTSPFNVLRSSRGVP